MVIGIISIIGALIALVGTAMGKSAIIGVGVILFIAGFLFTSIGLISLPWYVYAVAILLTIIVVTGRGKK